jgi:hypothetical protein
MEPKVLNEWTPADRDGRLVNVHPINPTNLLSRRQRIPARLARLVPPDIEEFHSGEERNIRRAEADEGFVCRMIYNTQ